MHFRCLQGTEAEVPRVEAVMAQVEMAQVEMVQVERTERKRSPLQHRWGQGLE